MIVHQVARACKEYSEQVGDREPHSVPKQPCPYHGSHGTECVWYWGWYERKEGNVPCGDDCGASGPILIRRFYCHECKRTFSWRPRFLVFGRPFAAVFYQGLFKAWALGPGRCRTYGRAWYHPGLAACKAALRTLSDRAGELIARFTKALPGKVDDPAEETTFSRMGASASEAGAPRAGEKMVLWQLSRRLASSQRGPQEQSRYSCHFLWMALARHRSGDFYSLESA